MSGLYILLDFVVLFSVVRVISYVFAWCAVVLSGRSLSGVVFFGVHGAFFSCCVLTCECSWCVSTTYRYVSRWLADCLSVALLLGLHRLGFRFALLCFRLVLLCCANMTPSRWVACTAEVRVSPSRPSPTRGARPRGSRSPPRRSRSTCASWPRRALPPRRCVSVCCCVGSVLVADVLTNESLPKIESRGHRTAS